MIERPEFENLSSSYLENLEKDFQHFTQIRKIFRISLKLTQKQFFAVN